MRSHLPFLACLLLACVLGAGEATPPGAARLLDDANAAVAKAKQVFEVAQQKERDRLAAALVKEQDRETRAGNLDTALAIKALIAEVKAGRQPASPPAAAVVNADDLLGDGPVVVPQASVGAPVAAALTLDRPCRVAPGTPATPVDEIPAALRPTLTGAVMVSIPKGDTTRLVCTVTVPGMVVAQTGASQANNAEIWVELEKAGFTRLAVGANFAWFTLQAKAGATFPFYGSPRAGYPVQLFAKAITPGR